ncbi:hypothetical protein MNBD_GAMMA26-953 [hydrothermal vent metagenome]|uniref:Lipoprotein n=1 Tax=hydrothermal vent metagenome TaxID=652676 RepID=A0A3B1B7B1_9ZZZZ
MIRAFTTGFVLLLSALLLSGCQTLLKRDQQKALEQALRSYETAIRWSYIRQAYGFLRPEKAKKVKIPTDLENIRVTNYEILEPATGNADAVMQVALIRFVEKDRQQERTLTDRQLWEYDIEDKRWYLMSNIPVFVAPPKIRTSPLGGR